MKEIKQEFSMGFCPLEELSEIDRNLVNRAIGATDNSYAKYSNFNVGAALLLEDGSIVIGANQENAAFPSGLCAERTAVFAAQAQRPDQPVCAIAIAARNENGLTKQPISPCGACRQVLLEVEDRYKRDVRILLYGTEGVYIVSRVKDILPLSFVGDCMK